jgi:hypothetical protein
VLLRLDSQWQHRFAASCYESAMRFSSWIFSAILAVVGLYLAAALQAGPDSTNKNLCAVVDHLWPGAGPRCASHLGAYAVGAAVAAFAISAIGLLIDFGPRFWRRRNEKTPVLATGSGRPLRIELGHDENYIRTQHIKETGILRKTIHVSVFNELDDDIADCNIRLIASTPVLKIGDFPATYPIFFGEHFDLAPKKRKFIGILSFVESGATTEPERSFILISAAVGGFFGGWTTTPTPPADNPAILTLEAFAPSVASTEVRLKIWVDKKNGQHLCAQII